MRERDYEGAALKFRALVFSILLFVIWCVCSNVHCIYVTIPKVPTNFTLPYAGALKVPYFKIEKI